jgi:hypothetical protein
VITSGLIKIATASAKASPQAPEKTSLIGKKTTQNPRSGIATLDVSSDTLPSRCERQSQQNN